MRESYIITSSGEIVFTSPENGHDFSLKELQESVNGYIEIVPIRNTVGPISFKEFDKDGFTIMLNNEYVMVINSEGKLEGREFNYAATVLASSSGSIIPCDYIVGDVLICTGDMIK